MSRSVWKGPFVDPNLLKMVEKLDAKVVGTEEEFPADCEKQLQYLIVALQYATTAAQNLATLILEPQEIGVEVEEKDD